jgi:predicted transcriptional regulator
MKLFEVVKVWDANFLDGANHLDKETGGMTVKDLAARFGLQVIAGVEGLERRVEDGYCGDLLSEIMANAPEGCVWLTTQGHQNIVAVAVLRKMAGIIIVRGRMPDDETLQKANQEGVPILLASESAYQLAGRLYSVGVGSFPDKE